MLRRLVAAMLVAAFALPMPALAKGTCSMTAPMIASERCSCCDPPAGQPAPPSHCTPAAAIRSGCNCSIQADTSSPFAPSATTDSATSAPAIDIVLIPAALSTPQRVARAVLFDASPPGAGATVSLPFLCSWIL
jgi:hypothetical protein